MRIDCVKPCRRVIFQGDFDALKPGKRLSHKCRSCKTVTTLEGTETGTAIRQERAAPTLAATR